VPIGSATSCPTRAAAYYAPPIRSGQILWPTMPVGYGGRRRIRCGAAFPEA